MVHCDFTDLTRTPKDVPVLFTHLYTFDSVDLLFAFPNTSRPFMYYNSMEQVGLLKCQNTVTHAQRVEATVGTLRGVCR